MVGRLCIRCRRHEPPSTSKLHTRTFPSARNRSSQKDTQNNFLQAFNFPNRIQESSTAFRFITRNFTSNPQIYERRLGQCRRQSLKNYQGKRRILQIRMPLQISRANTPLSDPDKNRKCGGLVQEPGTTKHRGEKSRIRNQEPRIRE
jgi:hypothetical protein